jgi:hypothetical protein
VGDRLDREQVRGIWAHAVRLALEDCRSGDGADLASAAAWFGPVGEGGTRDLAADALDLEPDLLRGAARRLLAQRFGALEAARLLAEPLLDPRRRARRRRTRVRAAPALAGAAPG